MKGLALVLLLSLAFCGSTLGQDDCEQAKLNVEAQLRSLQESHAGATTSMQDEIDQLTRTNKQLSEQQETQLATIARLTADVEKLQTDLSQLQAQEHTQLEQANAMVEQAKADCVVGMQQIQKDHSHQLAELKQEQRQQAELQDAQLKKEHADKVTDVRAQLSREHEQKLADVKAQLSKEHEERIAEVKAQLSKEYAQQVSEMQEHLRMAGPQGCTLQGVLSAVAKFTVRNVNMAVDEIKLVAAELQQGNTTRVSQLAQQAVTAVVDAHTSLHALISREMDKHLPLLKQQMGEAWGKAGDLYQQRVANAAWVQEVSKHFNTANTELKALLTKHIQAQPMLATLNDPVYIQLLAYALIGAPLMLLFLPVLLWLSTLVTPSAKATGAASKGSKKKKTAKGKH